MILFVFLLMDAAWQAEAVARAEARVVRGVSIRMGPSAQRRDVPSADRQASRIIRRQEDDVLVELRLVEFQ